MVGKERWTIKKTMVLNMNSAKERMRDMVYQLKILNIPYERFEAVDREKLSMLIEDKKGDPAATLSPNLDSRITQRLGSFHGNRRYQGLSRGGGLGVAGCAFSHMLMMLSVIDMPEDGPALILEDDVAFDHDFKKILQENIDILDKTRPDWELFLPGFCYGRARDHITSDRKLARAGSVQCTHAYVVRNKMVAQKLFDYADGHTSNLLPSDMVFYYLIGAGQLEAYMYNPNNIAIQNRDRHRSDIGHAGGIGNGVRSKPIALDV